MSGRFLADAVGVEVCGRSLELMVSANNKKKKFGYLWMWKSVVALAGTHQTFSTFFLVWTLG